MTKAKHTPGPWVADVENANSNSISILGPDPRLDIAVIINERCEYTDTDEANAYLLAAAPDLLEALEAVVALSDRKTDIWNKARSAIRKARGGKC